MTTLRDVALKAGVSKTTVSRVMNGKYLHKISVGTQKRILKIIDEMNYKPDSIARALRTNATLNFGLVIPNIDISFTASIVEGIQGIAMQNNMSCLLYVTAFETVKEEHVFNLLMDKKADGIIWIPGYDIPGNMDDVKQRIPVLQLMYKTVPDLPAITINQIEGGMKATEHLVKLGHKRMVCLASSDRHGRQRLDGFLRVVDSMSIKPTDVHVLDCGSGWHDGYHQADELFQKPNPPTAVFATTDLAAWGALRAAKDRGLSVPSDVSIIGFDDLDIIGYIETPMTTVYQPKKELGELTMRSLLQLINNASIDDIVLDTRLVVRSSTSAPRTNQQ